MEFQFSDKLREMKPSAIREIFKSLGTPGAISFAGGNPAPESFPVEELSALAADIFANNSTAALQYGISEGVLDLCEDCGKAIIEKAREIRTSVKMEG